MIIRDRVPLLGCAAACLLLAANAAGAEMPSAKVLARYKQMLVSNPSQSTALDRLWTAYADQGRSAELLAEYGAATDLPSQLVHGHFLRKATRNEEAAAAYGRAAEADPKSPLPLLALGELRSAEGKWKEAAEALERAASLLPENDSRIADVLFKAGTALLSAGDTERAAHLWEKTLAFNPGDLELRRRLCDAYIEHQLDARAVPHLEHLRAHAAPAERARALRDLAGVHQRAGRQDETIRSLEDALAFTAPGNWLRGELQGQLVRLHQRWNRTEELEAKWLHAVQENPRDAAAYVRLIDFYERTGSLQQQIDWLEKLATLTPKNTEHRLRLARLHARADQLDRAAAIYDELLMQQPRNAELVFERARIDIQSASIHTAERRIRELVEQSRGDDSLRGRALEFFETHRLHGSAEEMLQTNAAGDEEEAIVALARFFFAQKRQTDAAQTLQRLVRPNDSPEKQAAAYARIAEELKSHHATEKALDAAKRAVTLQPDGRRFQVLFADLAASSGRREEAESAYEKAVTLSQTAAESLEADQKLFELFRSRTPPAAEPPPGRAPVVMEPGPRRGLPHADPLPANPTLEEKLLALTRAADTSRTSEGWLRVARWQLWSRNPSIAQQCAKKALALDPKSLPVHEFLIQLAIAESNPALALQHLNELATLNPAQKADYLRRAGQIELQSGRAEAALKIFEELAESHPGDPDTLGEVALAQQRVNRWEEALATWQQVFAIVPGSRRKEVVAALVRVYEKLERHPEAAVLLLQQVDAAVDPKERESWFHDLLTLAQRTRQLPWLREQFARRRQQRFDDFFTEVAFGRVLKAAGEKAEAFKVLSRAAFAAPNQTDVLPELVREAEELRQPHAAIRLQEQLIRLAPQNEPNALEKLAQLQERALEIDAATRTWERIVLRFPRDAQALQRAVEFQLKWGLPENALGLLRRLRELDGRNARALSSLADLAIETGSLDEAEQCLEEVLQHPTPDASDAGLRFPGLKREESGRLQNRYLATVQQRRGKPTAEAMRALRSFWVEETPRGQGEVHLRLEAIADLARLTRLKGDPIALEAWVNRWRTSGSATERLWAFYHCGATEPLMRELEKLIQDAPADPLPKQAFIWLALQTGQVERLGNWVAEKSRTATERDYVFVALDQHLQSGGDFDADHLSKLFPPGAQSRVWQAAQLFANRSRFGDAIVLGRRVFDSLSTQRPGYGVELAHWHLYRGEVDAARAVLRESLETTGESFEAPVYTALREYAMLLPREERAPFAESFCHAIDASSKPIHRAISGAVLFGVAGDIETAQEHLRHLLELRPAAAFAFDELGNSATRRWDFLLAAGAQLQSWQLHELAIFLWENALADSALVRLEAQARGDSVRSRAGEMRTRLAALRLMRATPGEAREIIAEHDQADAPDALIAVAEALETLGAFPRAIAIYQQLWGRDPQNVHAVRNLLNACRAGGDTAMLEEVLRRSIAPGVFRPQDPAAREFALQLSELLEKRDDPAGALSVLQAAIETAPYDGRLTARAAQLHVRLGNREQAEAAFRKLTSMEPGNVSARVSLAEVLDSQGRTEAAVQLLENGGGAEVDALLARLFIKLDRVDEALSALERLGANAATATFVVADALVARNDADAARAVLRQAVARAGDPRRQFPLQAKLVELLPSEHPPAATMREFRKLREMASEGESLATYFESAQRAATRLAREEEFERELREQWNDGDGPVAAGVALLAWTIERNEAAGLDALCDELLFHRDASKTELGRIAGLLAGTARPGLEVKALERIARTDPMEPAHMILWAQRLHRLGKVEDAFGVLEELGWRAVLNREIPGKVAQALVELGAPDRARRHFADALQFDPDARNSSVHLAFAGVLLEKQELGEARRVLQAVYRNPGNREYGRLLDYLDARGHLETLDEQIGDFGIENTRLPMVGAELLKHYERKREVVAAAKLLTEHPELISAGVLPRLRALAKTREHFIAVAEVLEQTLAELYKFAPEAEEELAHLELAWAEFELAQSDRAAAIKHLEHGHELRPEHFAIAKKLSGLYGEAAEPQKAIDTLQAFITASRNPAEKEQGRQLLGRLRVP